VIKYLVLLAVVGLVIWWLRRGRAGDDHPPPQAKKADKKQAPASPAAPTPMLACAHCGVHLPQAEAVTDGAGRPFCGEAHRLAGPR
jgi:uncharacterized protein